MDRYAAVNIFTCVRWWLSLSKPSSRRSHRKTVISPAYPQDTPLGERYL
ncbi:MAG: hypothetical protein LBJ25_01660 [Candidatus Margulisbacteria bacterium]|nr:hypothetical protein [Candidatus Margulisiibacteriota bacterium]